jgi:hypothetical protein
MRHGSIRIFKPAFRLLVFAVGTLKPDVDDVIDVTVTRNDISANSDITSQRLLLMSLPLGMT